MTDYTPPIEVLAAAYIRVEERRNKVRGEDYHQSPTELRAEFDRAIASVKADAWDEGRTALAFDMVRPLRDDMTRESTENPYRKAES